MQPEPTKQDVSIMRNNQKTEPITHTEARRMFAEQIAFSADDPEVFFDYVNYEDYEEFLEEVGIQPVDDF